MVAAARAVDRGTIGPCGWCVHAPRLSAVPNALRLALLGPRHPDTLESQVALAGVLVTMERFAEARDLLRNARGSLGPGAPVR